MALCIIEGLGSLLAFVVWPYVFSHLGSGKLEKVFAADEGIAHPDDADLRWFFKVVCCVPSQTVYPYIHTSIH